MAENSGTAGGPPSGKERRTNPVLRDSFEKACELTCSLFDAHNNLGDYQNLKIYTQRIVHEAFPFLSMQDVALLSAAVAGYHRARVENQPRK